MIRLYYNQVDGFTIEEVINDAHQKQPDEVIIMGETEWEAPITKELVDRLGTLNVKLRVLHGSFKSKYYEDLYKDMGLPIENVEFWGTSWLNWTEILLQRSYIDYKVPTEFKYPFISMNNRSHIHRCMFIDELTRIGMLEKGAVSWIKHLNENKDYPFKYFDNQIRTFNDDFKTKLDSFIIPDEFHQSFFHVVVEATNVISIVSEKTIIPLLFKKPFVSLSAQGFNKELVTLGFKMYDELIDYSFDDEPDLHKRVVKFTENVPKIVSCDSTLMYQTLKPKIEFNYNHAISLMNDKSRLPKIMLDRCKDLEMKLVEEMQHDRSMLFLGYTHG